MNRRREIAFRPWVGIIFQSKNNAEFARRHDGASDHCALNVSHDTFECQLTNVPAGFSFHAQTCSV